MPDVMEILLVYKRARPDAAAIHNAAVACVERVLGSRKLSFDACYRENLRPELVRDRLIITVGGDGTFLETSHYVKDNILLGVNSNPVSSVGSLCVADTDTFEQIFERYLSGNLRPVSAARMQLELDGKILPILALNDILIANQNPAAMTRYWIDMAGDRAMHKNSGLWVCTACGSTGAVASTGGVVQSIDDQSLQWICREPYFTEKPAPKLLTGFLAKDQSIKIASCMDDLKIFVDGPHHSESFLEGQQLTLSISKYNLNWLMTAEMELRRQQIGVSRGVYAENTELGF